MRNKATGAWLVFGRSVCGSTLASILAVFSTAGCDAENPQESRAGDAARDDSAPPRPFPLPDISCEPNLDSIQSGIFAKACSSFTCHSANGFAAALVFEGTDARQELVNVDSVDCVGWKRVVPGAPEQSLLWNKLSLDSPACGERMPWLYERMPAHALECIRQWIVLLPSEMDAQATPEMDAASDSR